MQARKRALTKTKSSWNLDFGVLAFKAVINIIIIFDLSHQDYVFCHGSWSRHHSINKYLLGVPYTILNIANQQ